MWKLKIECTRNTDYGEREGAMNFEFESTEDAAEFIELTTAHGTDKKYSYTLTFESEVASDAE